VPPLPVVPNVLKTIIGGTYHDARWINIFYTEYTGSAPSSTDIDNYISSLLTNAIPKYADEMSTDNEVTSLEGIDLASYTGASHSISASVFGVRTGDFQPASVALVGSMEINRRYRGGHPRKYLPWGTSGTMASGSTKDWDSSFLADCQTKFSGIVMSDMVGFTSGSTNWVNPVNVSYVSGGARRVTPVVDVVTSVLCRPRICTQRRRLGKVGG
jgi:hypothetical protein